MNELTRLLAATLVVALTCVFLTASAPRARAGDAVVTVHIRDNVFEPASLRIAPGTTVRWVNEGHNRHDVKPNRGYAFGSGKLRPGQSYAHTFAGTGGSDRRRERAGADDPRLGPHDPGPVRRAHHPAGRRPDAPG
jgi:plastocyanin